MFKGLLDRWECRDALAMQETKHQAALDAALAAQRKALTAQMEALRDQAVDYARVAEELRRLRVAIMETKPEALDGLPPHVSVVDIAIGLLKGRL